MYVVVLASLRCMQAPHLTVVSMLPWLLTLQAVEIARGVFTAVCLLAWFAHFGEAAYAHHLAKERGRSPSLARQWCTQTLLLGYFSLYHLRRQVCTSGVDLVVCLRFGDGCFSRR